jgi:hypothetical protein
MLVNYDPFTGITETIVYDELTDGLTIRREQDCTAVIDFNKEVQNDSSESWRGADNDFWRGASIPVVIIEKWRRELGVDVFNDDHWPAVRRLLNSPDWRWLKTTPKRL